MCIASCIVIAILILLPISVIIFLQHHKVVGLRSCRSVQHQMFNSARINARTHIHLPARPADIVKTSTDNVRYTVSTRDASRNGRRSAVICRKRNFLVCHGRLGLAYSWAGGLPVYADRCNSQCVSALRSSAWWHSYIAGDTLPSNSNSLLADETAGMASFRHAWLCSTVIVSI